MSESIDAVELRFLRRLYKEAKVLLQIAVGSANLSSRIPTSLVRAGVGASLRSVRFHVFDHCHRPSMVGFEPRYPFRLVPLRKLYPIECFCHAALFFTFARNE